MSTWLGISLRTATGDKKKVKALKKKLDVLLKKKTALDKDREAFAAKGGDAYLVKLREAIAGLESQ